MGCLVAIHQPNFFPWLGYFDKVRRADVFVFLDDVSYPRAGSNGMGSWCNRVRIAVSGEPRWVTCPVRRMASGLPIRAVEIDESQPWRSKLLKTLQANYGRAANYGDAIPLVRTILSSGETNLADFNIAAVKAIAGKLGLSTAFVRQSELTCSGQATELLASLVEAVGGDAYLAGGGAAGYQVDEVFAARGIRLVMQEYAPRHYGSPPMLPGLSVIDYLMKDGSSLAEG